MIVKTLRLEEITKGVSIDRGEKSWGSYIEFRLVKKAQQRRLRSSRQAEGKPNTYDILGSKGKESIKGKKSDQL